MEMKGGWGLTIDVGADAKTRWVQEFTNNMVIKGVDERELKEIITGFRMKMIAIAIHEVEGVTERPDEIEWKRREAEDGDDEGRLVGAIDDLADDVRRLIPVEGLGEYRQLEILLEGAIGWEAGADRPHEIADIPSTVAEGHAKREPIENGADHPREAIP